MKSKILVILNFLIWLTFSPILIFTSKRKMKVRLLLILFSPFTCHFISGLFFVLSMMSTPEHIEYDVNHYFKNSDSIFKYTKWNIPPFDTVTASYEAFFLDGGVEEKIRLRKNLDSNNTKELENLCINDSLWKETDSTFFFRGRFSYYDYLNVSVSKGIKI